MTALLGPIFGGERREMRRPISGRPERKSFSPSILSQAPSTARTYYRKLVKQMVYGNCD
jgi:hypothetical protein